MTDLTSIPDDIQEYMLERISNDNSLDAYTLYSATVNKFPAYKEGYPLLEMAHIMVGSYHTPEVVKLSHQVIKLHYDNMNLKESFFRANKERLKYKRLYEGQRKHGEVMLGQVFKASLCLDQEKAREVFKSEIEEAKASEQQD